MTEKNVLVASEFSEEAAEMIAALLAKGFSSEVILMLARAYGSETEYWVTSLELFIVDVIPAKKLEEPLKSLITKENLENVSLVLKEKGLIKEFGESFKVINYFCTNFPNDPSVICVNGHLGFPYGWILTNINPAILEKRVEGFNKAYDWCCNNGIPEGLNSAVRAYMYEVLTKRQYEEIISDIYGIPNKYCGYSLRSNPDILEDAKRELMPHVSYIVRILMIGIEKYQF